MQIYIMQLCIHTYTCICGHAVRSVCTQIWVVPNHYSQARRQLLGSFKMWLQLIKQLATKLTLWLVQNTQLHACLLHVLHACIYMYMQAHWVAQITQQLASQYTYTFELHAYKSCVEFPLKCSCNQQSRNEQIATYGSGQTARLEPHTCIPRAKAATHVTVYTYMCRYTACIVHVGSSY